MTWTRGIRNLTRHPLYLIITLLPVLLITLLLFPLMQNVTALIEQIAAQQAYGAYYEYHEEWSAPEALQLASAFMPILGMGLLISLVSLLTQLLLTPISFQYLGDATRLGYVPAGFAGRGLRRMWWKPCVYSLLLSLCLNVSVSSVMLFIFPMASLLHAPLVGLAGYVMLVIVLLFVNITISMVTAMVYASIALEDLPFFTAVGRAFSRTFSHFGRLLGAMVVTSTLLFIFSAIPCVPFILSMNRAVNAIGELAEPMEVARFMEIFSTRFALLALVIAVLGWLANCFITSYSFQLTHECLTPPQPPEPGSSPGAH